MKSPNPETQGIECIFQKKYLICAGNFTNKYQGQANHDTILEKS